MRTRSLVVGILLASSSTLLVGCYTQYRSTDTAEYYRTYAPPPWAPPYDNVSQIQYYYFPDYECYYDVWSGYFWVPNESGRWVYVTSLPPRYGLVDLDRSFIILLDREAHEPWEHHRHYRDQYPPHVHEHYGDVVRERRLVNDLQPGDELYERSFNENTDRVTFMQHPVKDAIAEPTRSEAPARVETNPSHVERNPSPAQPPSGGQSAAPEQGRGQQATPERQAPRESPKDASLKDASPKDASPKVAASEQPRRPPSRVAHEVPMRLINPSSTPMKKQPADRDDAKRK